MLFDGGLLALGIICSLSAVWAALKPLPPGDPFYV